MVRLGPRLRREPVPPQGVRLEFPDGHTIPLECRYDGVVDGAHLWTAVITVRVDPRAMPAVRIDVLPTHTAVGVEFAAEQR